MNDMKRMTTVLKMSLLADNTTDVNALMQTVLASNKSQASTSETATIVQQPTAFETQLSELNAEKT